MHLQIDLISLIMKGNQGDGSSATVIDHWEYDF